MDITLTGDVDNSTSAATVTLNANKSCFAVAMANGFRVYNLDPPRQRGGRLFQGGRGGGLGRVQMLDMTNIVAIVGGGRHPLHSSNKLVLWDDVKGKELFVLDLDGPIRNCILTRAYVYAILDMRVLVFKLGVPSTLLHTFETCENYNGLCVVHDIEEEKMVVCPARHAGHMQIIRLAGNGAPLVSLIRAHDSALAALAVDKSGKRVASASEHGTLVRLWDTNTCQLIGVLRRGVEKASILSMAFSDDEDKLALVSHRGTLHVFSLASEDDKWQTKATSPLAFGAAIQDYLSTERKSFAKSTIPDLLLVPRDGITSSKVVIVFGTDGIIVVAAEGGRWWKFVLREKEGETSKLELAAHKKFLT